MTTTPPELTDHLSAAIEGWEEEAREVDTDIAALVMKKDALNRRIEAARVILGGTPDAAAIRQRATVRELKPAAPVRLTITKQWQDIIMGIVSRHDRGCSYADLRAGLRNSPLGPKLAETDKTYQRAMNLLGKAGAIERAYGRVFTPEAFRTFNADVEAGEASPTVPQPMARSPMGEAILGIIYKSPGLKPKQIIAELRKDTEFNATLTPHETGAFNIIARLVRRHQITKRDDGGCLPGPAFPYELLGLSPDGVGALVALPSSAPIADKDYPSLPFSQPATSRH